MLFCLLSLRLLLCSQLQQLFTEHTDINCNKYNVSNEVDLRALSGEYNRYICSLKNKSQIKEFASRKLLRHVVAAVLSKSVPNPKELNKYKPFSSQVYGEASLDVMEKIINDLVLSSDDVFVDLGSSIGNVIIFIAGAFKFKTCIGIEIGKIPSKFAIEVSKNFKKFMNWFGKDFSDFNLIEGDFLNEQYRQTIENASIVFTNNFKFGEALNLKLVDRFSTLKIGSTIISTVCFRPPRFRTSHRNKDNLANKLKIREIKGKSFWSNTLITYFVQQIVKPHSLKYCMSLAE